MRSLPHELNELRERYADARVEQIPGAGRVCIIPAVPTGPAWTPDQTEIRFLIPQGYPQARPDCFYATSDLELNSGRPPQNARPQRLGDTTYLWFSWHLRAWDPSHDDLTRFARSCERRLRMDR